MDRRYVLAGITVAIGLVTAVILRQVLETVFFAATVAYVLAPVEVWYSRRGVPNWWSALLTTVTGMGIAGLVLSPLVVLFYFRFSALRDLIASVPVPDSLTLSAVGFTRTVRPAEFLPAVSDYLQGVALSLAGAAPVVAIKATVFGMVVFALLLARSRLHAATWAVVPPEYHDALDRLTDRATETLFAIYVLQGATALATFAVSVPLFFLLGYQYPFTLATVAGFLQFLPIVGPSVLVVAVGGIDVALDNLTRAALVLGLGFVFVAWLPDPLVRPRLARRAADMPGSLYFVGFTGGLFTLGVVGIVAGPLVVALLSESVRMLAEEMRTPRAVSRQSTMTGFGPPVDATAEDDPDVQRAAGAGASDGDPPDTAAPTGDRGEDAADVEADDSPETDDGDRPDAGGRGPPGDE